MSGQSQLPSVGVRFANPQYDEQSGTYWVDVELQSNQQDQQLFGMNVRFFYDATKMAFTKFRNFADGYDILGDPPVAHVGNASSGEHMFNFDREAAYVNGAVQLQTSENPQKIGQQQWTKLFEVCFTVSDLAGQESFCPSLIWDLKEHPEKSSFFRGSDGVVFTVMEKNPATPQESAPAITDVEHFNWKYDDVEELPFGIPVSENCISLSEVVSSNNWETVKGFKLFQNEPNPFDEVTWIGFRLPKATEATLHIFDSAGRTIARINNDYPEGYNRLKLDDSILKAYPSGVLYYQLETPEYVSEIKKMTLVGL